MKIKINDKLIGVDGITPITSPDTKAALTLKDVCINSILSPIQDEDQKAKYEKYELYKKLRDAKADIELTAEQIVLLKNCVGKFQPPLIMGQVFDLLEKTK